MRKTEICTVLGIMAVLLPVLLYLVNEYKDCNKQGGVMVRGLFLYSCVEAVKR